MKIILLQVRPISTTKWNKINNKKISSKINNFEKENSKAF